MSASKKERKLNKIEVPPYIISSDLQENQVSVLDTLTKEEQLCYLYSDNEYFQARNTHHDELPAFEIRSLSPSGRTPSPIDIEILNDIPANEPILTNKQVNSISCNVKLGDFITLEDVNAQISPMNALSAQSINHSSNNLETIFEDIPLDTPTKKCKLKKIGREVL